MAACACGRSHRHRRDPGVHHCHFSHTALGERHQSVPPGECPTSNNTMSAYIQMGSPFCAVSAISTSPFSMNCCRPFSPPAKPPVMLSAQAGHRDQLLRNMPGSGRTPHKTHKSSAQGNNALQSIRVANQDLPCHGTPGRLCSPAHDDICNGQDGLCSTAAECS